MRVAKPESTGLGVADKACFPPPTRGMTMSTNESKRNSSEGKQEQGKQAIPAHTQSQHSVGTHKPLPFDDAGGSEEVAETSNPQKPPINLDF